MKIFPFFILENDSKNSWQKSLIELEQKKYKEEERKRQLECYNLTLRNISLEKELGKCVVEMFVFDLLFLVLQFVWRHHFNHCHYISEQLRAQNVYVCFSFIHFIIPDLSRDDVNAIPPELINDPIYTTEFVRNDSN